MTWLASRLLGTPLLIHGPKLDVILSVLGPRLHLAGVAGGPGLRANPTLDLSAFARPAPTAAPADIAVIPIHGSLVKRAPGVEAASGLMSYAEIASMLDAALADPQVGAILLDIDSPGGEASGSFELARQVRAAASVKPVWALANDAAYSAAYAIAASAQRLFVTETGGVGSIGVIALHVDQSAKDARDGYRFTAVAAGAHKNDFSPHEPLSEAARTQLQAEVERLYAIFTAHVADMRRMGVELVRATQAQLYFGPHAQAAGLADGVRSMPEVLAELAAFIHTPGRLTPQARALLQTEATSRIQEDCMPAVSTHQGSDPVQPTSTDPVQIDAQEGAQTQRSQAYADAQLIAELCQLSGKPELTAAFLGAQASVDQVRSALLAARAQGVHISSQIAPLGGEPQQGTAASSASANLLMAAVKKLQVHA